MSWELVTVTTQAVLFSMLSTTLAQVITIYQHRSFSFVDIVPFIQFMIIAIVTTPPNYLYQRFLEDSFPSKVSKTSESGGKLDQPLERLSLSNTVVKFVLEQSLGATVNTLLFICLAGLLTGKSADEIILGLQKDFWPMLSAGWKVWPMVTLFNYIAVPFEQRMLVGNTAGVLWGVYMNLKMQ